MAEPRPSENDVRDVLIGSEGWLTTRRWFGDKSRSIGALRPLVGEMLPLGADWISLVISEVEFVDGGSSQYFIPVVASASLHAVQPIGRILRDGIQWHVSDALESETFRQWFVAQAAKSAVLGDRHGSWRWHTFADGDERLGNTVDQPTRLLSGEQSNTSIRIGDEAIAKVFRKVQPGLNPDVEIGSFLRTRTDFTHAPALLGIAEWRAVDVWSIAAFQAFQPNQGDGWTWLLRELENEEPGQMRATLGEIVLLGQRTGELHVALASTADNEDFRPEPYDRAKLADEIDQLQHELALTLELAATHGHGIQTRDVATARTRLEDEIQALQLLAGTSRIRIHGDYHLGQVLRTQDADFSILDFEGEPARPVEQRRQKTSALRDVAGMLRSLDYALAFVEKNSSTAMAEKELRGMWSNQLRTAFLTGYRRSITASSETLVPLRPDSFSAAVRVLEIQKALYEVRYELDNRPDWVCIPLGALGVMS